MSVAVSYPGVYIDEVPSQVRTIVGVPTSITAFIGSAPRGEVDTPIHITSWGDFDRRFGGLSDADLMSYMVFQYFQNGGGEAEIVRVARRTADGDDDTAAAAATLDLGNDVEIEAVSPGAWGSKLRARVTYVPKEGGGDPDSYNLVVRDTGTGTEESFLNVQTAAGSPRALSRVLAGSTLVRAGEGSDDTKMPDESAAAEAGQDPFADAAPEPAPPPDPDPDPPDPDPDPPDPDPDPDAAPAEPPMFIQGEGGDNGSALDNGELKGEQGDKTGIYALEKLGNRLFNLMCVAPVDAATDVDFYDEAAKFCLDHRAVLLVDPPTGWTDVGAAVTGGAALPVSGANAKNAAIYFPRIDLLDDNGNVNRYPPSGAVAGVIARTDGQVGVWKAAAGTDASVASVRDLSVGLTNPEHGQLNPLGVNCIRNFPVIGTVVWGARTMRGADQLADQWKYLPVRRTALFIEESLYRGTQWVVFQPNDEPLWSSIRLNVGAFMNSLWRQGAFQGTTPDQAYVVKCDSENNPQNDIDKGIVNILVGFAPLKPAEFVVIHIQQLAGQIAT